MIEFIPGAGACLVSRNIVEGRGRITFLVRDSSADPADNGWRIMSDVDTDEYLSTDGCWQIMDFNAVCEMEPAVIGIWNFPVGSELELVRHDGGMFFGDMTTGQIVDPESFYVPPPPPWR